MLDQVYGKQGDREAGLMNLREFVNQFPRLAQLMKTAPGGDSFLGELTKNSPVQQARSIKTFVKSENAFRANGWATSH
jgi:hypothetical protein